MDGCSLIASNAKHQKPSGPSIWAIRAAGLVATACTFGVALVLAPQDLTLSDEKHVLWQVSSYGWLEVARNLMRDSHPPLYYWLVKGWWEIGGFQAPWTYRVFSVLLGLPALPLAVQVGRLVGGPRLGLMLAAALMLNPFYLFLLVLIRMYGLAVTVGALLTFLWLRLLERPTAARWGAWSVIQGALMFTHYYGILLIGAQWLVVWIRRPRGWIIGTLASLPWMAAFVAWTAQAYAESMKHTVRVLSLIPVRPTPWEVLWHLWANLSIGPFADGRVAQAAALAGAALLGVSLLAARRSPRLRGWQFVAVAAWLPPAIGALLALRWPFFAARYFAMSLVPLIVLTVAGILRARWRPAFAVWLLLGQMGLASLPLINFPLGLEDEVGIEHYIRSLVIPEPALVQAPWHLLLALRSYLWSDPAQRAQVIERSPSFWFIGVTLYRDHWADWLRDLQATHLIDFQMEFPHSIPEYRASVFHLVRKVPAARWLRLDARWANGIRMHEVGWVHESVEPGRSAQWHLKFSADQPLDRRWTLFIHLVDETGRLWANWDAEPDPPTDRWAPNQVYDVGRSLLIPRFVPAGRYQVNLGWYETGTPGFPRLPLMAGGDVLTLGWIEVRPIPEPARWGARFAGPVEMQLPEITVRPSRGAWRIQAQVEWRAREPIPPSAWEVVLVAPEGLFPFQRAHQASESARGSDMWNVETWVSPLLRGGCPALRWVEIRYAGHLMAREPVWLFPPSIIRSYDWLFLNRVWFIR